MGYLTPHASVLSSATQAIAVANTAQAISFNVDLFKEKCTHDTVTNNSRVYVNEGGQYVASIIAYVASTGGSNKEIDLWFAINGTNVPNSNVKTKLLTVNDEKTISITMPLVLTSGQYVEVYMSGDSTAMSLLSSAAGVSPTRPASPSIILTIDRLP